MEQSETHRKRILATADHAIHNDRNNQYGPPHQDFARTAKMWSAYLEVPISAHDVAAMMSLLKISRIAWSPQVEDHWVDLAGYAACGYEAHELAGTDD
jgi:hypothetical protein